MSDFAHYWHYTKKSRLDLSINSLLGLVEGISVDNQVTDGEISFLKMWLDEHRELAGKHPYNELMPVVEAALADGVLTAEEVQDIRWLCEKLRSTVYFNEVTADLQRLHAIVGGIASDAAITVSELRGLSDWLADHEHLQRCWPYEEIGSLVTSVLADGQISLEEHTVVQQFFSEFLAVLDNRTITSPGVLQGGSMVGLCAVCPEISVSGSSFCFTGKSTRYTRTAFSRLIASLGGKPIDGVTRDLDYLIIGADGNPCWAYACYGRKVEKAVELRKAGHRLLIVHENDLHDLLADQGAAA